LFRLKVILNSGEYNISFSLKNYKVLGDDLITAELIKNVGKELWTEIYVLLKEIWKNEEIPVEWNTAIIQPVHKKNDRMVCQNHTGISLLNVMYKIDLPRTRKRLSATTSVDTDVVNRMSITYS
jgi:hypothetical protein